MKLIGVALAIVVLLLAAYMVFSNLSQPSDLGLVKGQLNELSTKPNGVSSQTEQTDKQVAALAFKQDLKQSQLAALSAFSRLGFNQTVTRTENYIHVVFITPTMHYRDDVELYFDEASQLIHYRSQSRVGYSDGGLNLQRYQDFVKAYNH